MPREVAQRVRTLAMQVMPGVWSPKPKTLAMAHICNPSMPTARWDAEMGEFPGGSPASSPEVCSAAAETETLPQQGGRQGPALKSLLLNIIL